MSIFAHESSLPFADGGALAVHLSGIVQSQTFLKLSPGALIEVAGIYAAEALFNIENLNAK